MNRSLLHLPPSLPPWIASLLVIVAVGNVFGLFIVGVHTDESYYWLWSQYPDWGYYDHPPMAAWMIAAFSSILGDSKLALRLPAVLAWVSVVWVVFRLSRELFPNPTAGWLGALIVMSLPIFQVGFHIVGPDSPLMLFTALTYYFCWRAAQESSPRYWLLCGAAAGLALLGKFTAVLLPAIIMLALVIDREHRKQLARPWPWLAAALAALLFVPVVYWNYRHNWASFAYQWGHGTATHKGFSPYKTADYLVQQMSATLPWVFIAMAAASVVYRKQFPAIGSRFPALFVTGFWLPLVFFGITGSISTSMHNWPVIAYIPGSILLAGVLTVWIYPREEEQRPRKWVKRLAVVTVLLAASLVNLARFPQWVALLPKPEAMAGSSVAWVWGWPQLADAIRQTEKNAGLPKDCSILFVRAFNNGDLGYFHVAGEMAFHLDNADRILVQRVPHQKQYNLWQDEKPPKYQSVCMAVAGPAKKPQFTKRIATDEAGSFRLVKQVAIKAPDISVRHYAIYVR